MDLADIEDLFSGLGAVSIRRMFGGKGIYHCGLIVAVEFKGEVLLKADAVSAPEFEGAGARRWTYDGKRGEPVAMPYWSIPDEALDDPELMARWARRAYDAALRSSSVRKRQGQAEAAGDPPSSPKPLMKSRKAQSGGGRSRRPE